MLREIVRPLFFQSLLPTGICSPPASCSQSDDQVRSYNLFGVKVAQAWNKSAALKYKLIVHVLKKKKKKTDIKSNNSCGTVWNRHCSKRTGRLEVRFAQHIEEIKIKNLKEDFVFRILRGFTVILETKFRQWLLEGPDVQINVSCPRPSSPVAHSCFLSVEPPISLLVNYKTTF